MTDDFEPVVPRRVEIKAIFFQVRKDHPSWPLLDVMRETTICAGCTPAQLQGALIGDEK